ncbi:MAG: disaggregatase related repeat-containing protein [Candidatus Sumerlaeia bacterium]
MPPFNLSRLVVVVALIALSGAPARAATYYVATDTGASNTNTGTQASPWRTIAYAASKAVAGDTVYIKAGNYGNEHVVVANSGTAGNRITFEGYGGTVLLGTLPSPRTTPEDTEVGFKMTRKNYITLRNLNFTWYYECVYVELSDYVILENLVVDKCGGETYEGDGIVFSWSDYGTIKNCTVTDCGGNNVFLHYSNHCTIDGLTSLGTLINTDTYATDYYCALRCSSNNLIKNSHAEDQSDTGKGNHGFIIKDLSYTPNSTGNVIQDCTAIGFEECFSAAHKAYGNTFLRCTADNTDKPSGFNVAFQVRNGAHDNTFRDCTGIGRRIVVGLTNYDEGNSTLNKAGNKWINCTLKGTGLSNSIGVFFDRTSSTVLENCVFDKVNYFARYTNTNTNNSVKNSILSGMVARYDPVTISYPFGGTPYDGTSALAVTYTDFFDNDFPAFSGAGNLSADPLFANQAGGDYHLKSTIGRWSGSAWVQDTVDSPCIDAGDQSSNCSNEPAPNGARINIGRHGNTTEASKSPSGTTASPMDNRLLERTPTTVYAANSYLDLGHLTSYDKKYRDLVWFDLSAYDNASSISQATLSLYWYYPTSTRTNDTVVDIYRPAAGWDHAYVCWTNKASGTAWTNPGGDWFDKNGTAQGSTPYATATFSGSQTATGQYYAFDVTDLVKEYITSGQNAGFFIKARTESDNYIAFCALDNTDAALRPKFAVTLDIDLWVDFAWTGTETGSQAEPFNTLAEGVGALAEGRTLHILAGQTAETGRIVKPMRIVAENGTVRLGGASGSASPAPQAASPGRNAATTWMLYR